MVAMAWEDSRAIRPGVLGLAALGLQEFGGVRGDVLVLVDLGVQGLFHLGAFHLREEVPQA